MKSFVMVFASLLAVPAFAESKVYQVTGPVVEVRNDAIVIEKGKERWEIARNRSTKVQGELKKGARVTVGYRMTAVNAEVKAPPTAKGKLDRGTATAPTGRPPKPAALR